MSNFFICRNASVTRATSSGVPELSISSIAEGTICHDIVYADSISPVAAPGFRFTGDATHPSIADTFRRSIATLGELRCDILIGAHPFVGDLDGKWKRRQQQPDGPNPFVDPGACRALAAGAMKALDARIAEEAGKKN